MANLLQTGMAWLSGQLKANASQSVLYVRAYDQFQVLAVKGNKPMRVEGDFGPRIEWTGQDWIVPAADLRIAGELEEPARHDRIYETSGGVTREYEVLPPSDGEPPWRWSDPYRTLLRIHTKLVAEEDACACPPS